MTAENSSGDGELAWFAVQTKPCQETLATRSVSLLGLDTFFPRIFELASGRARAKALFPSYFFARFSATRHLRAVGYSTGVCRVVGTRELPCLVEDEIIESIRDRIEEDGFIR